MTTALRIGLTGGIGCGKSLVADLLKQAGMAVRDADDVARAALAPGQAVYAEVVKTFGAGMVDEHGNIRRSRLADLVFGDPEQRAVLNDLVHPAVLADLTEWMATVTGTGAHAVAVVPLLFETGFDRAVDRVLCIAADRAVVVDRLHRQRGWSEEETARRMAAQWPVEKKVERSDDVIWNNGDVDTLTARVDAWRNALDQPQHNNESNE